MKLKFTSSDRKLEIAEITPTSVTQGQTYANNEAKFGAKNAIDEDLSTLAAVLTDGGTGWLKLEFDRSYFIHKIVIYWRFYNNWYDPNHPCAQTEAGFKSCAHNHNNVDVSVYQGEVKQTSCGTLQLGYQLEQSDQIYTLLCNAEGDIVKLSKDQGHIAVYEVAVTSTSNLFYSLQSMKLNMSFLLYNYFSSVQRTMTMLQLDSYLTYIQIFLRCH